MVEVWWRRRGQRKEGGGGGHVEEERKRGGDARGLQGVGGGGDVVEGNGGCEVTVAGTVPSTN